MTELVKVKGNDIFTDSWIISEATGNAHDSVTKLIKKYSDIFKEFGELSTDLKSSQTGRKDITIVLLNEPQSTLLMTFLVNSKKVVLFKKELVKQFYAMRRLIMEQQTSDWQALRQQSKDVRRLETDTIQQFVTYARDQGSTHAGHYYTNLTKLVNKAAGIRTRNLATGLQLNTVMFLERMIGEVLRLGMRQGKDYRDIYDLCKGKVLTIRELALLEAA